MAVGDLAAADPLPRVARWLSDHPAVVEALGGPGRVGADNAPPYPRLRLLDTPGGDDRDLRWLTVVSLQVEALGDLDGAPGKEALRRALYTALGALAELPNVPCPPGLPVITAVRSARAGGWVPEPSGQPRYVAEVRVYVHRAVDV